MPRNYRLNWDDSNKCWYKYLSNPSTGKRVKVYLGRGKSKTNDNPAYKAALTRWAQYQARAFSQPNQLPTTPTRERVTKSNPNREPMNSIEHWIKKFLRDSSSYVQNGTLSVSAHRNRENTLRLFLTFLGPKAHLGDGSPRGNATVHLNGDRLAGFHKYLLRLWLVERRYKVSTVRIHLALVKVFYRWCLLKGLLTTVPRNLNSTSLHFKIPTSEKERMDDENEIKIIINDDIKAVLNQSLLTKTAYPTPLVLVLALNTGMNLIDIGGLQLKHLQYDESKACFYLEKRRSKTGVRGRWRLWDETAEMLFSYITCIQTFLGRKSLENMTDYIFCEHHHIINKLGATKSVASQKLGKDGRPYIYNNLTRPIGRVFSDAGVDGSIRFIRTTAATAMKHMSQGHQIVYQTFLAHTPTTMADRKYAQILEDEMMDEYVLKLPAHYDIQEILPELTTSFIAATEERFQCPIRKTTKSRFLSNLME